MGAFQTSAPAKRYRLTQYAKAARQRRSASDVDSNPGGVHPHCIGGSRRPLIRSKPVPSAESHPTSLPLLTVGSAAEVMSVCERFK